LRGGKAPPGWCKAIISAWNLLLYDPDQQNSARQKTGNAWSTAALDPGRFKAVIEPKLNGQARKLPQTVAWTWLCRPWARSGPSPVLPRLETGIQVKKGKMEPAEIPKEMTPKGVLPSSITELISANGAYLIVSAAENCSKTMLDRRRSAMRDAVAGEPNAANLLVDFSDSSALARWVSSIPSVHLWLREKLGLPLLRSWKPYGAWSSTV
jgi:hypothetical protein